MKRALALMLAVLSVAAPALAETVSAPTITSTATVLDSFTIIVDLRRDIAGFPDIANDQQMNFGNLTIQGGTLNAVEGVVAFVTTNSHQDPYTVNSVIANPLTRSGGTQTIPNGAFVLNAAYAAADNGGAANEGTVNYSGTAIGTHPLYVSGGTHSQRTVQGHYYVGNQAPGSTTFIPADQADGVYTTNLIISATR